MSHCSSAMSFDMLDRSEASSECSESWERLEKSPAPAESCSSVTSIDMLDDADSLNGEESSESFSRRELREIGSKTPTPQEDVNSKSSDLEVYMKNLKERIRELEEKKKDKKTPMTQNADQIKEPEASKDSSSDLHRADKTLTAVKTDEEKAREEICQIFDRMSAQWKAKKRMPAETREVYREIEKKIRMVESGELAKAANDIFDRMEKAYLEAVVKHVEDLQKIQASIREDPWQDISKDLLGSFPEFTAEFVALNLKKNEDA